MLPARARAVFISYARSDNEGDDPKERWLDRLLEFIKPLVRQEEITVCSDRDIKIGDDWRRHLEAHLNGARAAVLLVSPAFLASDYIADKEVPLLLRNAADKGVEIFTLILSPCLFEEAKFKYPDPRKGPHEFTLASLQAANTPSRTLVEITTSEQSRVLKRLAKRLVEVLSTGRSRSRAVVRRHRNASRAGRRSTRRR